MKEITLKELELKEDIDKQLTKLIEMFGPTKFDITITPTFKPLEKRIPFLLRGNIGIIHKSDKEDSNRIIAGYANVAVIDDDEQYIPLETLKEGIKTLLEDSNYSNLMLMHKNIQIGRIIDSYNELSTKVDEKGLFIVCEIRKDLEIANEIWSNIIENQIRSFSIGCEVIKDHRECDDEKCITVLDKINIFEVSVCSNPVNKESGFVIISKSQDTNLSVCQECNNTIVEDSMSKEKVKAKDKKLKEETPETVTKDEEKQPEDTSVEEKTETEEKTEGVASVVDESPQQEEKTVEISLEDKLNELTQKINALEATIQSLMEGPEEDEPEEDTPEGTEEEPEEEEMGEKSVEEKPIEETPAEEKSEEGEKINPYDELKKSVDSILERIDKLNREQSIDVELKARDDQINALSKKIEILTKSNIKKEESDIKTTQENDLEEKSLEVDKPFVIEKGRFYKKTN